MTRYQAIVVEDTAIARKGLIKLLGDYPAIEVIGEAENIQQAAKLIYETKPDLMFLDIQMPGGNAFDLLADLTYTPNIIFTTAYSDFALQAFEYPTVDYLLKPINREKLGKSIAKIATIRPSMGEYPNNDEELASDQSVHALSLDSKLFIKDTEQNHILELAEISLFESCKNHTRVYFQQHRPFVHKALSHIESRLPTQDFFRINRSQVVNIHHIKHVMGSTSQGYKLDIGLPLPYAVSRRQSVLLKDFLSL